MILFPSRISGWRWCFIWGLVVCASPIVSEVCGVKFSSFRALGVLLIYSTLHKRLSTCYHIHRCVDNKRKHLHICSAKNVVGVWCDMLFLRDFLFHSRSFNGPTNFIISRAHILYRYNIILCVYPLRTVRARVLRFQPKMYI